MNRNRCLCIPLMFAAVMTLASCSEEPRGGPRMLVIPVHGELYINGEPAKDAFVWLHPTTPLDNPNEIPVSSKGQVDADGKFEISTYESGDGVPIGEYKISVTWNYPSGLGLSQWFGPDRLSGKFADAETTGLSVSVIESEEPIVVPRIELAGEIVEQGGAAGIELGGRER